MRNGWYRALVAGVDEGESDDVDRLRPVDVRRAILGVFLRSGRELGLGDVQAALVADGLEVSRSKISDVMHHQVRAGRATVRGRGRFTLDPMAFSESTRRRCLDWQAAKRARERRYLRGRNRSVDSGGVG